MPDLIATHRSSVTADQIDHLGHMNVRYYGANARQATLTMLQELGLPAGVDLDINDIYTRHHREQMLGARLATHSAVLDAEASALRLYHELRNVDSGQLAATFVHRLTAPGSLGPGAPLPPSLVAAAAARTIDLPAQGQPRSVAIDGDPLAQVPPLAAMVDRGLAIRRVRTITAAECDGGAFRLADAPGLVWDGDHLREVHDEADESDDWLIDGPHGERMGWASMETRMVIRRLPGPGDRTQSFSTTIALADKVSQRIYSVYDVDRGDLLLLFEVVNLAFDIVTRRPMPIPAAIRAEEEQSMHPELFGRLAAN